MNRIVFDEDSESAQHDAAAAAAVASLESIMGDQSGPPKRKRDEQDESTCGKQKKELTAERREERNQREKERSLKISQQINELRNLLSTGGVIVPKGTKSTILSEAANYIRHLQQNQYRSEMDRAQLINEVQRISNGVIGPRAAVAIRHVANQNGAASIANMGDMPPPPSSSIKEPQQTTSFNPDFMSDNLTERGYRCVFNSCAVGMAIATMGGSFIDCNLAFTKLSNYSQQELKATTIFNLTSREDLQGAFDMMSQLITPSNFENNDSGKIQPPVILRSSIKHRDDLGLSVSLIRGDDGVAKYFNVTLVKLPSNGLLAIPAMADMSSEASARYESQPMADQTQMLKSACQPGMNSPRFTSG